MTLEPIMQLGGDFAHAMVTLFDEMMSAEGVPTSQRTRVVNRVKWGTAEPDEVNRIDEFGENSPQGFAPYDLPVPKPIEDWGDMTAWAREISDAARKIL